jgi:hypothetical protein
MPTTASRRYTHKAITPKYQERAAVMIQGQLVPSVNYVAGQLMAENAVTPGLYGVYVHLDANYGRWSGVLQYDCAVDSAGNITLGGQTGGDNMGITDLGAPIFIGGYFDVGDLVGFSANALTDRSGARLVQGPSALTSGTVEM